MALTPLTFMNPTLWLTPQIQDSDFAMSWTFHEPVLLGDVIELLRPAPGALIFDATLGGGGHTRAMLEAGADVIAMDRDKDAIAHAADTLREFAGRLRLLHGDFRNAAEALDLAGVTAVDGVLLDLGVSSWQLDTPERGFSFQHDGPLDMRMDASQGLTAADIVNTWSAEQLADAFFRLGEESGSRRAASAIVKARAAAPIVNTARLADVIETVLPRRSGRHPATKIFQALRMAVNDELGSLRDALESLPSRLKPGGRMAVISFHSLEDRIVKEFFRERSREWIDKPGWPEPIRNERRLFNRVTAKPVQADEDETRENRRARSAKLRVVERRNAS